ncbi:MAG: TRAP transporter large permease subunit [Bdellovibrionales bacterium]
MGPRPEGHSQLKFDSGFRRRLATVMAPPLLLILAVLGSILAGIATPTEAASVGVMGALLLASIKQKMDIESLRECAEQTTKVTSMVFTILIGASVFPWYFVVLKGTKLYVTT